MEQMDGARGVHDQAADIIIGAGLAGCVPANGRSVEGGRGVCAFAGGGHENAHDLRVPQHDRACAGTPLRAGKSQLIPVSRGRAQDGSPMRDAMPGGACLADERDGPDCDGGGLKDVPPLFERPGRKMIGPSPDRHGARFVGRPGDANRMCIAAGRVAGPGGNADFNARVQKEPGIHDLARHDGLRGAFPAPIGGRFNLPLMRGTTTRRRNPGGKGGTRGGIETPRGRRNLRAGSQGVLAGAVGSPGRLPRSGTGPAVGMRAAGWPRSDPMGGMITPSQSTRRPGRSLRRCPRMIAARFRFCPARKGSFATKQVNVGGFARPECAGAAPDIQPPFAPHCHSHRGGVMKYRPDHAVHTHGLRPKSMSEIRLAPQDAAPGIDHRVFTVPEDAAVSVGGIRIACAISEGAVVGPVCGPEILPCPSARVEDEIAARLRAGGMTVNDPVDTGLMGGDPCAPASVKMRGIAGNTRVSRNRADKQRATVRAPGMMMQSGRFVPSAIRKASYVR